MLGLIRDNADDVGEVGVRMGRMGKEEEAA